MVLNEPLVFTGAGYFLGIHAPGRRGMKNFLPAIHHATLCQAVGGSILRDNCPNAQVDTTYSCRLVEPYSNANRDIEAARRADTLLNRLFIEPTLGLGYPVNSLPVLRRLDKYMQTGDEEQVKFNFDFYGLQNYTREIIRYARLMPYIHARPVSTKKRNVAQTLMSWEVYPPAIYHIVRQFHERYQLKRMIITENGAAFKDKVVNGRVNDPLRIKFLRDYISQCLKAKNESIPLNGYFVWTLTDNFEWAEGYRPTFGLVHVDFTTQKRTLKDSACWYANFLAPSNID